MTLEITASEDMPKEVFVKQRVRNFTTNQFEDTFAAVCTPAQLEDFDVGSPAAGSSYFRASLIDIVSRNLGYLEQVFNSIVGELKKLVQDEESLNILIPDGVYTISADTIDVNTAILHTHYRIPLAAKPAGNNEVYTDTGHDYQRVASEDTNQEGWLNTTTPNGCFFKYNIAKDSTLSRVWPPSTDKIGYAHLEKDGVSLGTSVVLINEDGIFWKSNLSGSAPFPSDYVNAGDPGTPISLVLDFIV